MDDQLDDGLPAHTGRAPAQKTGSDQQRPVDPLRRVLVPVEKRNSDGSTVFQTKDGRRYIRDVRGVIRRARAEP